MYMILKDFMSSEAQEDLIRAKPFIRSNSNRVSIPAFPSRIEAYNTDAIRTLHYKSLHLLPPSLNGRNNPQAYLTIYPTNDDVQTSTDILAKSSRSIYVLAALINGGRSDNNHSYGHSLYVNKDRVDLSNRDGLIYNVATTKIQFHTYSPLYVWTLTIKALNVIY